MMVKLWEAKWVLLNIYSLENASSIIVWNNNNNIEIVMGLGQME